MEEDGRKEGEKEEEEEGWRGGVGLFGCNYD